MKTSAPVIVAADQHGQAEVESVDPGGPGPGVISDSWRIMSPVFNGFLGGYFAPWEGVSGGSSAADCLGKDGLRLVFRFLDIDDGAVKDKNFTGNMYDSFKGLIQVDFFRNNLANRINGFEFIWFQW